MLNPTKSLIIVTVSLILLAVIAYLSATTMVDAIYAYRSPLSQLPLKSEKPVVANPITSRIVIVLVDALRLDTSLDPVVMPVLNEIRSIGASAAMRSGTPSFSAPGYATILTGAYPYLNDGPAFNLEYEDIPALTQENLFGNTRQAGMDTAISGYYWFEKLVPHKDVTFGFFTPGEDHIADVEVMNAALPWVKDKNIELVLIHLDQVDFAGHHEGGAAGEGWKAAATRVDTFLGQILEQMDLDNETLLIFSDHGQIDRGGHGGAETVTTTEPFVIAGKGINRGVFPDMEMVDIAPTVSVLLGISIPATAEGQPLYEMLTLQDSTRATYENLVNINQQKLSKAYLDAIQVDLPLPDDVTVANIRNIRITQDRWQRAVIIVGFLLAFGIILFNKQKSNISIFTGLTVYLLVFNMKYLFIDGSTYSFSSIISPTSLIVDIAINAIIALVFAMGAFWLIHRKDSSEAKLWRSELIQFTGILCLCLMIPVVIHAWWNGFIPTWTLPDITLYFFALAFLIQILIVSISGILLSLIFGTLLTKITQ